MTHTKKPLRNGIFAMLLAGNALTALDVAAAQRPSGAAWKPSITERLLKLPSMNIKKALDKDFHASPLAEALRDTDAEIALKLKTLHDLQSAIDLIQQPLVDLDAGLEMFAPHVVLLLHGKRIVRMGEDQCTRLNAFPVALPPHFSSGWA